jgi:O-antigen ligase
VALAAAALLGPALALPPLPQLSVFRVLLAAVILVGATYIVLLRRPLIFAAKDLTLPIILWYAWLCLGVVWAADKTAALQYIAIVTTMMAALLATAAGGGTRRRLLGLCFLLALAYAAISGFAVLETLTGIHLSFSQQATVTGVRDYTIATGVFVNQNNLATYLAMCWPFMLAAFFFTRRWRWLALNVIFILMGAAVFIRTGSRSSLIAAGISTLGAVVLYAELGTRLSTRTGKIVGVLVAVVIVAAGSFLLFNNSQSTMLRQFRLEALLSQAQHGSGSGAIRTDLTSMGLQIVGRTLLLGAGAGQAEQIISSGLNAIGIPNLHDWWLETYADGGIVGFGLQAGFFCLLIVSLWPIARRNPDPLLCYLAGGTFLALIGFTVGALGPSSSSGFAPLWILYGLGLAVVSRARLAAAEHGPALPEHGA